MALARVVAFDGVTDERIAQLKSQIEGGDPQPEGLNATEMLLLHNSGDAKTLAIVFFDSEEDYARGDEILSAMPSGRHPRAAHVGIEVRRRDAHDAVEREGESPRTRGSPTHRRSDSVGCAKGVTRVDAQAIVEHGHLASGVRSGSDLRLRDSGSSNPRAVGELAARSGAADTAISNAPPRAHVARRSTTRPPEPSADSEASFLVRASKTKSAMPRRLLPREDDACAVGRAPSRADAELPARLGPSCRG